jgi:hypothetical protein
MRGENECARNAQIEAFSNCDLSLFGAVSFCDDIVRVIVGVHIIHSHSHSHSHS